MQVLNKVLILCFVLVTACNNPRSGSSKPDVLAADIDSTVNPADDFFDYANGGWIKKNPIPADESGWGLFQIIPDENLKRLENINLELIKTKAPSGSADQKIGDFWKAGMDTSRIENTGITPLEPYLNAINSISDPGSLQKTMASLDRIGIGGAIGFYVGQDPKNSSLEALQLWQTGLGLPERDYYFKMDSTSVAIRSAYTRHIATILSMIGKIQPRPWSLLKIFLHWKHN